METVNVASTKDQNKNPQIVSLSRPVMINPAFKSHSS